MRRIMPWLSAVSFVLAVCLGVVLWFQSLESRQAREEIADHTSMVAALRRRAAMTVPSKVAVAPRSSEGSETPILDEATRLKDRQVIADRNKQFFRRNAVNSYIEGFEILKLSPEIQARAKELIIAQRQEATEASKEVKSVDEAITRAQTSKQALDDRMTALIGADSYAVLKASTLVSGLDRTIGTDMWDGGAPLRADQLRSLAIVQSLHHTERTHYGITPSAGQEPDPQTGLSAQDRKMLAASADFLAPAQQEILQRSLVEENRHNAAMRAFGVKQKQRMKEQDAADRK